MKASPEDRPKAAVRVYEGNGSASEAEARSASGVEAEARRALEGDVARPERQLPPGGGKIERIAQHSKGLVQDLTSWVELKMKLTQIEIEEKIEARANQLLAQAIVAALAALGGLFALITLSLGLAALFIALGLSQPLSYMLGFLVVTLILFVAAMVVRSRRPQIVHVGDHAARVEDRKLTARDPAAR